MKRNKKGVMPEINREIYKSVKKFDRQQFESFCMDLYGFGFQDGEDSVDAISLDKVYEIIAGVNGIGPKKLEDIKAALEAAFKEADTKEHME